VSASAPTVRPPKTISAVAAVTARRTFLPFKKDKMD
jgi:hypothetical protein